MRLSTTMSNYHAATLKRDHLKGKKRKNHRLSVAAKNFFTIAAVTLFSSPVAARKNALQRNFAI